MIKFLRDILASFLGSLAGLFFFLALSSGGLILFFLILLFADTTPQVENQSAIVFDLSSQIRDHHSETDLENLLSEDTKETLTVRQITKVINQAAADDKIVALLLDGRKGNISTGYGSLSEIRTALEKFKASGKKIFAYSLSTGEKDYFLTSLADEINLHPMGIIEMNGLGSSQLFFAEGLQKYGIGVQVLQAGKFKSAVEPFVRDTYSQESREQTQDLLTDIWDFYLETVTTGNDLTEGQLNNIADNKGILQAEEAQELNLIDNLAYFDDLEDKLKAITNSYNQDSFRQVTIKKYLQAHQPPSNVKDKNCNSLFRRNNC